MERWKSLPFPVEAPLTPGRAQRVEIACRQPARRSLTSQRRALLNRAVAIDAIDFDGVARLAVQFSVAVTVLLEMAVDAMHSLFQVDVFQVHGLLEFVRIVERNLVVVGVEQIAFAVVLEDRAENPSVTVEIGELRVLELLVEFRRAQSSRGNSTSDHRPRMAARSGLRA